MVPTTTKNNATVFVSCAISLVLGTIHAFSVLVPQWEAWPDANRASVSLVYSIALLSLTIAVLFGYRIYRRLTPHIVAILVGLGASIGLWLSAGAESLPALYLSYGVLFGTANGLGYGYALQLAGQAWQGNRGLAMGLVTAFYAVGATIAAPSFVWLIRAGGNSYAMHVMSGAILATTLFAAWLLWRLKVRFRTEAASAVAALTASQSKTRLLLWAAYGCAVAAGLMVIGHAFGIAAWRDLPPTTATWAPMLIALGNMLGGFSAGFLADRLSSRTLLQWLPLASSFGLLLLLVPNSWFICFAALAAIGYCYGAIIAVFPVTVSDHYGELAAPRIYGQVFTAWGIAGLLAPWFSGWLFDLTERYQWPIVIAAVLSVVSMILFRQMPSPQPDS